MCYFLAQPAGNVQVSCRPLDRYDQEVIEIRTDDADYGDITSGEREVTPRNENEIEEREIESSEIFNATKFTVESPFRNAEFCR